MQGSIRVFSGLFMTFAGVGTIEQSITSIELAIGVAVSVVGLYIMNCGVRAINKVAR